MGLLRPELASDVLTLQRVLPFIAPRYFQQILAILSPCGRPLGVFLTGGAGWLRLVGSVVVTLIYSPIHSRFSLIKKGIAKRAYGQ